MLYGIRDRLTKLLVQRVVQPAKAATHLWRFAGLCTMKDDQCKNIIILYSIRYCRAQILYCTVLPGTGTVLQLWVTRTFFRRCTTEITRAGSMTTRSRDSLQLSAQLNQEWQRSGINFRIMLVGESGLGKSTFTRALLRPYVPEVLDACLHGPPMPELTHACAHVRPGSTS